MFGLKMTGVQIHIQLRKECKASHHFDFLSNEQLRRGKNFLSKGWALGERKANGRAGQETTVLLSLIDPSSCYHS